MKLKIVLAIMLAFVATAATAHDFWLELPGYRARPGQPVAVRFLIGDTEVEPWDVRWQRIVSLRSFGPDGVTDQQRAIRPTTPAAEGGATVTLATPGTHVLAFESNHAFSDLPAAEFTAYAEHEGLTAALDARRRAGTTAANGRELYSRRAKALIQVGDRLTTDPTRPIGQTLEIVPERNPYALAASDPLVVRILYHGAPLAGASVVLEPLDGPPTRGTPVLTDPAGRASFPLKKTGRWRVGIVWTQPITDPRADFETTFASLTFGY